MIESTPRNAEYFSAYSLVQAQESSTIFRVLSCGKLKLEAFGRMVDFTQTTHARRVAVLARTQPLAN
jgi:hypothetical protein